MSDQPHLIERMENLCAALDEAQSALSGVKPGEIGHEASARIEDAYGIAGEVLTMIDGR